MGSSRSTNICRRMEGIRNSGRQKEWHTVARTSLETEVQELSQKTKPVKPGSRVSVFRKKGGCGSLVENGGGKKVIQFGVTVKA